MIRCLKHILKKRRHEKWKREHRGWLTRIYPLTPSGQRRRESISTLKQWAIEDTRDKIRRALDEVGHV